ncbi:class I SAM-dependent methyltransferase [Streptomyces europaeiscabiei]|uniref:class I SAM-dependent methyltransferase n=1 Tax=Streptomyces europaeiscabiei TaxID=146819 RepID=UPI0029B1C3BF|nr:class I SAM-dependent methyltransferase [Streptomyces europaeiscabiei]MDX2757336.1 class I SAM-dependent methyltransferase [Streptomyces europaeiscabiei]
MTLTRPASTGAYWNDRATASAFAKLPVPPYLEELLATPAPEAALALDAGCGAGRNLPALAAAGYRVLAIDLHPGMLEHARRHAGPRTALVEADVTRLPVGDERVSLVVCHGVLHNLHHRDGLAAALRELYRVLVPAGTLSLNLFTAGHLDPCLTPLGDDRYALPNGQHMTLLSPEDLVSLIHASGFVPSREAVQYLRPGDPGQRSVWRAILTKPQPL